MKKILLVDDEEGIQMLYREELEDDGYEVISAYTGEEGLQKFKDESPDLVVLDIQMPGMNGIETLRQMKMNNPDLPVILSTAYSEYKQDLGAWASDEYVVKSSDISDLKEAIRKHLS
ncbi:MAG: response regulator [Thermodesulfobacteriota bacterium]|nr:response regulator [Thermodesulfobacteriota bacterium]